MLCKDVEMNTIGDYKIPKHVTDKNTLEILMENRKKTQNSKLNLTMSFLYQN